MQQILFLLDIYPYRYVHRLLALLLFITRCFSRFRHPTFILSLVLCLSAVVRFFLFGKRRLGKRATNADEKGGKLTFLFLSLFFLPFSIATINAPDASRPNIQTFSLSLPHSPHLLYVMYVCFYTYSIYYFFPLSFSNRVSLYAAAAFSFDGLGILLYIYIQKTRLPFRSFCPVFHVLAVSFSFFSITYIL